MSNHILIGRKVQQSGNKTYVSHECDPWVFYCYNTVPCGYTGGVQDLKIGESACPRLCPNQNICLQPDREECTIGLSSTGKDPLLSVTWDERAPNLKCIYDLNNIDTADQLRVYNTKFPTTQNLNTIMSAFCGEKHVSTTCATGLNEQCSRFLARDEEGRLCRDWLATLSNDRQDMVMRDYCLSNDTIDCKCINRSTDSEYNKLKSIGNYFSDNCWYKPCTNSSSIYLVPTNLSSKTCATNVCQQIIEAHTNGNIDIEGNTTQIDCTFSKNMPNPDKSQPPVSSNSHWYDYWYLICFVIIAIIVIIISI